MTSSNKERKPLKLILTKTERNQWKSRYMTSNELILRQTPIKRSTVTLSRVHFGEFENQQENDDGELLVPMSNQPKYDDQNWVEDNHHKNRREKQTLKDNIETVLGRHILKGDDRGSDDEELLVPMQVQPNYDDLDCVQNQNETEGEKEIVMLEHVKVKTEKNRECDNDRKRCNENLEDKRRSRFKSTVTLKLNLREVL